MKKYLFSLQSKTASERYDDLVRKHPDMYTCQVVFDDERGQYLVVDFGWNGDKYLHATPIHISLIGNKVWFNTMILKKV